MVVGDGDSMVIAMQLNIPIGEFVVGVSKKGFAILPSKAKSERKEGEKGTESMESGNRVI